MRVAIVGSRRYPSEAVVRAFVRSLPPGTVVVSGGAQGVDSWAESEARKAGLVVESHPVEMAYVRWLVDFRNLNERTAFGRAAHSRNKIIAEKCDRLVAFRVGDSPGTSSTIRYAREAGKPVEVFDWPETS